MRSSILTGTGLVTPAGDGPATMAAIRAGRVLTRAAGRAAIALSPQAVDQALGERAAAIAGARPSSWRRTGPGVRAGILAAIDAVTEAGLLDEGLDRTRLGLVIAGHNLSGDATAETAAKFAETPEYVPPSASVRMWDTDALGLVSQLLRLRGEAALVGGASASGLIAVNYAHHLIAAQLVDACLVVAPAMVLVPWQLQALLAAGAMRPVQPDAGDPGRPFAESHDGFVPSELAAAVVLEHPAHAAARGSRPLGEQRSGATLLAATSGPEPDAVAERDVMLKALDRAGLTPGDIDYVNTHGTGSPRGDVCELDALADVFGRSRLGPFAGSTKALLGHGMTAAGLVEYVVTATQLREGFVHPMLHLTDPLPHPGVRLQRAGVRDIRQRAALTTSFGFGGIHAAAVLAPLAAPTGDQVGLRGATVE
jgi:malonyl-ACP decarboxylase